MKRAQNWPDMILKFQDIHFIHSVTLINRGGHLTWRSILTLNDLGLKLLHHMQKNVLTGLPKTAAHCAVVFKILRKAVRGTRAVFFLQIWPCLFAGFMTWWPGFKSHLIEISGKVYLGCPLRYAKFGTVFSLYKKTEKAASVSPLSGRELCMKYQRRWSMDEKPAAKGILSSMVDI